MPPNMPPKMDRPKAGYQKYSGHSFVTTSNSDFWVFYRNWGVFPESVETQCYASLAQLVEQLIRNQRIAGSISAGGSIYFSGLSVKIALKPLFCVQRAFLAYLEPGSESLF